MKIIKTTTSIKEIQNLEIEYISIYSKIYNLTNSTLGGEYYGIGKAIDVYDYEFNFIDSFSSIVEACEFFNLDTKHYADICAVCKRKRNYAHGKI
jgi:hypothetical protein